MREAVLKGDNEPLTLLHEACMAYAEATLSSGPVVYEKDASGRRILGKSQAALGRIFCCAYAWRFTGEERFLRHAEQDMLDVCAFPDWNPTHFLDVGDSAACAACRLACAASSSNWALRESMTKSVCPFFTC